MYVDFSPIRVADQGPTANIIGLFHCHISWHISEGLGLQFLETKESIHVPDSLTSQCADWQAYYETAMFKQEESGL